MYIVQVWNGRYWAKVRGPEGGPWRTKDRAERIAQGREQAEKRTSSTEGMPHRVTETPNPPEGHSEYLDRCDETFRRVYSPKPANDLFT